MVQIPLQGSVGGVGGGEAAIKNTSVYKLTTRRHREKEEDEEEFFNHYKNNLKRHARTVSGDATGSPPQARKTPGAPTHPRRIPN